MASWVGVRLGALCNYYKYIWLYYHVLLVLGYYTNTINGTHGMRYVTRVPARVCPRGTHTPARRNQCLNFFKPILLLLLRHRIAITVQYVTYIN